MLFTDEHAGVLLMRRPRQLSSSDNSRSHLLFHSIIENIYLVFLWLEDELFPSISKDPAASSVIAVPDLRCRLVANSSVVILRRGRHHKLAINSCA